MRYFYCICLCIFSLHGYSQKLTCRVDTVINMSNRVEYKLKNDTTVVMNVIINNNSIQKEYYYLGNSESYNFIPKFVMRFENSFIFFSGTHQHYRLLTLFQLEGNKIVVYAFENELMLNSSNDEFEKIFFLYKGQPAIIFIGNKNDAFVRLYKKYYPIDHTDIKYITISKKQVIVTFKNSKKKAMSFDAFKRFPR